MRDDICELLVEGCSDLFVGSQRFLVEGDRSVRLRRRRFP